MLLGTPLCSLERACQGDFGGALQSGYKTLWCGENYVHTTKVLLLAKTLIGCWKIYQILHFLCHFQANHQEARHVHSSTYSQPSLGIHVHGLYF